MGDEFDVVNPATEEIVERVRLASGEEVDAAVARGRRVFPSWRDLAAGDRGRLLR
ncbi:aldehyde dehydrogenase family protein, partial [Actinomadura darangshiensis]